MTTARNYIRQSKRIMSARFFTYDVQQPIDRNNDDDNNNDG